jgi:RNA polymerase-binding transcription factor DksA
MIQDTAESKRPLTKTQIAELSDELRDDLRRLTPNTESDGLERRGQERRPLILAALERVRAGTYGRCLSCGEPIPYARLAAIPEAQTCIDCVWRRDDPHDR